MFYLSAVQYRGGIFRPQTRGACEIVVLYKHSL
jgi:hypothetical protein